MFVYLIFQKSRDLRRYEYRGEADKVSFLA